MDKQAIADALEGTDGRFDEAIREQHKLELLELQTLAAEMGVVRCKECGWWVAESEIPGGQCAGCKH